MSNDETLAGGQQEPAEVGPACDSSPPGPSCFHHKRAGCYTLAMRASQCVTELVHCVPM